MQPFIVFTVYYAGTSSLSYFDNMRTAQGSIDLTYSNCPKQPVAIYQGSARGTEWTLDGKVVARAIDVHGHEIHTAPQHLYRPQA